MPRLKDLRRPTKRQQDLLNLLEKAPMTPEELREALYPDRWGRSQHGGARKGVYTLLSNLEAQERIVWNDKQGKWALPGTVALGEDGFLLP